MTDEKFEKKRTIAFKFSLMIAGVEGKSISSIAENVSIGGVGYGVIVDNNGISSTSDSVESMAKTIEDLDNAIASQTENINTSSAAVEQMISNIESITQILNKNQDLINQMEEKSNDVKNSIANSVQITKEISTESQSKNITMSLESLKEKIELIAMDSSKPEMDYMKSFELTTAVKQQESVIMNAMREQSEDSF